MENEPSILNYRGKEFIFKGRPGVLGESDEIEGEFSVDTEGYHLTISYRVRGGALQFRRLMLVPKGDDIPSTLMRDVPIGTIRDHFRNEVLKKHPHLATQQALARHLVEAGIVSIEASDPDTRRSLDEARAKARDLARDIPTSRTRGGRKGKGDRFWATLSEAYLACVEVDRYRAIDLLWRYYQEQGEVVSKSTVRKWVARARERGWLTRSQKGVAGGEPGNKLLEWRRNEAEGS